MPDRLTTGPRATLLNRIRGRAARAAIEFQHARVRLHAWLLFQARRHRYRIASETALKAARRSQTVFVFGSGASLNDVTPQAWANIATHDTVGFNWFVHQRFVRCDYHVVREVCSDDLDPSVWRPQIHEYFDLIRENPLYADTTFLVQTGFRATNGNRAIGMGLLPTAHPIVLWRSLRRHRQPSESLREGLAHNHATLEECVNFAYLMGWTEIVLAGVDLYDRRYFWLPPDVPIAGSESTEGVHNTARTGLIDLLGEWSGYLSSRGVGLYVYNERSLLARTVPVWPLARAWQSS